MLVLTSWFLFACNGDDTDTDTAPPVDTDTDPDTDTDTDTDPGLPPPPDPGGFLAGEFCLVRTVFETSCVTGCHSSIVQGGDLDLQTDPHTALVNRPSRLGGGLLLVTPGDKVDSFAYRKMVGLIAVTEGDNMPPSGLLDPFVGELFGDWIDRGAINDCNLTPPGGPPPPPPPTTSAPYRARSRPLPPTRVGPGSQPRRGR